MEMFVFTEGTSEIVYMQKLRSFINKEALKNKFKLEFNDDHCIGGMGRGNYNIEDMADKVILCIRNTLPKTEERKEKDIAIWIDYDLFQKFKTTLDVNDFENLIKEKYSEMNFNFYYNYMNFEDFFILHFNDKVDEWYNICDGLNHFNEPRIGPDNIHLNYFKTKIFPKYNKRTLLPGFKLDKNKIENAIYNSRSRTTELSSDIVDLLEEIINAIE